MPAVSARAASERLNEIARSLKASELTRLYKRLRMLLVADTKRNFDEGHDPDGNLWPPLKRPRKAGRSREKPLRDTGLLMASMSARGGVGSIDEVGPFGVRFGTSIEYASFHQRGTPKIPQRKFLGVGRGLKEKLSKVVADFLADILKKREGAASEAG